MPVTNFVWGELSDNVLMETDENNAVTASYLHRPERFGELISQKSGFSVSYYHYDGQHSTRKLTGDTQNITDTYIYSAYGEEVSATGTTTNPFRYKGAVGYYTNSSTNDIYVRARMYQPINDRWLSKDPMGFVDGPNLYQAFYNSVVVDPTGASIVDEPQLPGDTKPGHFRDKAGGYKGLGYSNCCCSTFEVRYYPNANAGVTCKKICLKAYSTYRASRQFCPFPDLFDDWEFDPPKDPQLCWVPGSPKSNQSTHVAEWTDFPGFGPSAGEQLCPFYCRLKDLVQSWEVCAIGETLSGAKINLGCVHYDHSCAVTYTWTPVESDLGGGGIGGACRCNVQCTISRTGDIGNDLPPGVPGFVPDPYTGTEPDPDGH